MITIICSIIATALLTSITTIAISHYFFEKKIKDRLEAKIDKSLERLGDIVEERVRQGVINGISSIPSREVILGTTRTMAKTGAEFVGEGLNTLLGKKPYKPLKNRPTPKDK